MMECLVCIFPLECRTIESKERKTGKMSDRMGGEVPRYFQVYFDIPRATEEAV
jgi:hypothetical protein